MQHMIFWRKELLLNISEPRTDTCFPREATQACQDDTCKFVEKSHPLIEHKTHFTFDSWQLRLSRPCANDISTPIRFLVHTY